MNPAQFRNCRSGYSLVELVAALTIFSLGVVGALTLFSTCLRSASASRGHTHAVFLAERALEEKIAEADLYAGTDTGDFGDAYPGYTWELTVEDTDQEGLMQAQIMVSWNDRGRAKEFELTTLVAERTESYSEWTTEQSESSESSEPSESGEPSQSSE